MKKQCYYVKADTPAQVGRLPLLFSVVVVVSVVCFNRKQEEVGVGVRDGEEAGVGWQRRIKGLAAAAARHSIHTVVGRSAPAGWLLWLGGRPDRLRRLLVLVRRGENQRLPAGCGGARSPGDGDDGRTLTSSSSSSPSSWRSISQTFTPRRRRPTAATATTACARTQR